MSSSVINMMHVISGLIPSSRIYACAYANAEMAANAYNEGDYNLAARLWSQSDALIGVADRQKSRERKHFAAA